MIAALILAAFFTFGSLFCAYVYYGRLQTALKRVGKLQRNNEYLRRLLRRDAEEHGCLLVKPDDRITVGFEGETRIYRVTPKSK